MATEEELEIDVYGDGGENPEYQEEWLDTERKDEKPIDPGATTALLISDLHWWITEDDIRSWANEAACEDELKEVTFSEHKVNGKSKGQAYVGFASPSAATALKHKMESIGNDRKFPTTYTNPMLNPFKTLPKDAPARKDPPRPTTNNFQRGRGGYTRGNNIAFNNNRNFSAPNFNRGAMMNNPMRGMNQFGMRGRGMVMPQMTMNPMMGMGFPQGHFNPAFFGNTGGDWNPHGVKRTRQD